jgi:plastocyanin
MRKTRLAPALAVLLLAAAGAAADQGVTVGPGIAFSPSTVTVAPGEQVTWTWAAGTLPHSTTSDATSGPEVWDSGVQGEGAIFSHTFNTPGSYPYYCQVHSFPGGTAMNGMVIVAAPTTPIPTPTPTPGPPAPTVTPNPGGPATIPATGAGGSALLVLGLAAAALLLLAATRTR